MSEQTSGAGAPPPPGWYPDPTGQLRWWDGGQWGQSAAATPAAVAQPAVASDPRSTAMLAHLLGIFVGWLGPLIIYLVNGDKDPFVRHHAAEALNFHITLFIAYMICFVLAFVIIGFLLFPVVLIASIVFAIQGAMAAKRGEWWTYPVNLRMVPGAVRA